MYKTAIYLTTLIIGSIISYLINPLTLLLFLLIWIDAMILFNLSSLGSIGFELITLAGLISGLALGPIVGFFFVIVGMPIIITVLRSISIRDYFPVAPNLNFISIAITTAIAGFLLISQDLLVAVLAALIIKFIISGVLDFIVSRGFGFIFNTINTIFNLVVIYIMNIAGLIVLFA